MYTVNQFSISGAVEPWGIVFEPVTKKIWFCDYNISVIYILNLDGSVANTISSYSNCQQINSDGTYIYFCWNDGVDNFVVKMDPSSLSALGQVNLGTQPNNAPGGYGGLCFDNLGNLWVVLPNINSVSVVNTSSMTLTVTYAVTGSSSPQSICFDTSGFVWVASQGNGTIAKIDITTGSTVSTYGVGNYSALAILFDGTNLQVTTGGTSPTFNPTLYQVDPSTGSIINTLVIGTSATDALAGLAYDGTNLWVLDGFGTGGNNLIYQIDPSTLANINNFPAATNGNPILATIDNLGGVWASNNNLGTITNLSPSSVNTKIAIWVD